MTQALLFFYDPALPTHRDWVRYYLGDTSVDRAELDDREINALLAEEPAPEGEFEGDEPTSADVRGYRKLVASRGAEAIAAKYARESDTSFENQRTSLSAKFAQFSKLAVQLKADARAATPLSVVRW